MSQSAFEVRTVKEKMPWSFSISFTQKAMCIFGVFDLLHSEQIHPSILLKWRPRWRLAYERLPSLASRPFAPELLSPFATFSKRRLVPKNMAISSGYCSGCNSVTTGLDPGVTIELDDAMVSALSHPSFPDPYHTIFLADRLLHSPICKCTKGTSDGFEPGTS